MAVLSPRAPVLLPTAALSWATSQQDWGMPGDPVLLPTAALSWATSQPGLGDRESRHWEGWSPPAGTGGSGEPTLGGLVSSSRD